MSFSIKAGFWSTNYPEICHLKKWSFGVNNLLKKLFVMLLGHINVQLHVFMEYAKYKYMCFAKNRIQGCCVIWKSWIKGLYHVFNQKCWKMKLSEILPGRAWFFFHHRNSSPLFQDCHASSKPPQNSPDLWKSKFFKGF